MLAYRKFQDRLEGQYQRHNSANWSIIYFFETNTLISKTEPQESREGNSRRIFTNTWSLTMRRYLQWFWSKEAHPQSPRSHTGKGSQAWTHWDTENWDRSGEGVSLTGFQGVLCPPHWVYTSQPLCRKEGLGSSSKQQNKKGNDICHFWTSVQDVPFLCTSTMSWVKFKEGEPKRMNLRH